VSDATAETEEEAAVVFGDRGGETGVGTLAGLAIREYRVAFRTRWVTGLTLLFAVFSVGVVAFGSSGAGSGRYGAVVASLTELSVYLVPLAALAFGYGTVVGAIERGTLPMLFSLPVPRGRILVGMFLGRLAALSGALAVGLAVGGGVLALLVGVAGWGLYLTYLLAAVLTGGAFLAVAVLVSAVSEEKARALGGVLVAWVWFVLVHDLVALGALVSLELPDPALSGLVLANPAALFRVVVLSAVPEVAGGIGGALATTTLSPAVAVAGLVAWTVVPTALAVVAVRRRRV
jgi:Cu-processing system permease protein